MENPASIAEGLYYRGLIAEAFEQADTGPRVVVYVPDDLARALPMRKTSYSNLESDSPALAVDDAPTVEPLEDVQHIQQADTSVVDDMTTLLAYLQLASPMLDGDTLTLEDQATIRNFMLKPSDERIIFLFRSHPTFPGI